MRADEWVWFGTAAICLLARGFGGSANPFWNILSFKCLMPPTASLKCLMRAAGRLQMAG